MPENGTHYNAIIGAIKWREQMRDYVERAWVAFQTTNVPVISPVWLRFPGDATCALSTPAAGDGACARQMMFGDDYLAQPVVAYTRNGQTHLGLASETNRWSALK